MSIFDFENEVVKGERRTLKLRDGSLPYTHVSAKYKQRLEVVAVALFGLWATLTVINIWLFSVLSLFVSIMAQAWITAGGGYLLYLVKQGYKTKAIYQRLDIRSTREAIKDAEDRQRAAVEAIRIGNRNEYNRQIFEMRRVLLSYLETNILETLRYAEDKLAADIWEPTAADTQAVYEQIRKHIRMAKVPEYGVLRRSMHGVVGFVLGDRSCLPPDPTDEFLARRNMPEVLDSLTMPQL